jgi:transposase
MSRQFRTVDYEAALDTTVRLGDCLPQEHLARFVVDLIAQLDLSALYARYGSRGGRPYAPEILLALLFYAYATGVFSSRKIEQATRERAAFRFLAGTLSPDHDTIAAFRKTFLPELQAEVEQLFVLAEQADASAVPEGMHLPDEIARREARLERLAEAKAVLEARAAARQAEEQAAYEAKLHERQVQEERTGKKPRGKPPAPPTPGPRDKDQYNFTDPDSRVMKNSRDGGFDQHYNAQIAVDQDALLIVGYSLSNHANDCGEVAPTLATLAPELGAPAAAALDTGYFSEPNLAALEERGIEAYIATGRDPHHAGWQAYFAEAGPPPPETASRREKMAYKLRTTVGKAIYRRRKCPVEPVLGQIKEVLGFRQFSLRRQCAVTGEWGLGCLAFNIRRLHALTGA